MAEFAAMYGPPAPTLHWPIFLALVLRASQFEARQRLQLLDSIRGALFAGPMRDVLFAIAHPEAGRYQPAPDFALSQEPESAADG